MFTVAAERELCNVFYRNWMQTMQCLQEKNEHKLCNVYYSRYTQTMQCRLSQISANYAMFTVVAAERKLCIVYCGDWTQTMHCLLWRLNTNYALFTVATEHKLCIVYCGDWTQTMQRCLRKQGNANYLILENRTYVFTATTEPTAERIVCWPVYRRTWPVHYVTSSMTSTAKTEPDTVFSVIAKDAFSNISTLLNSHQVITM